MNKNDEVMLTTFNNPFNPFKQFNDWLNFDYRNGTDCCGTVARLSMCTNALSDELNDTEIERAMDSIVELMPTVFVKLHKSNADETIKRMQNQIKKEKLIS